MPRLADRSDTPSAHTESHTHTHTHIFTHLDSFIWTQLSILEVFGGLPAQFHEWSEEGGGREGEGRVNEQEEGHQHKREILFKILLSL